MLKKSLYIFSTWAIFLSFLSVSCEENPEIVTLEFFVDSDCSVEIDQVIVETIEKIGELGQELFNKKAILRLIGKINVLGFSEADLHDGKSVFYCVNGEDNIAKSYFNLSVVKYEENLGKNRIGMGLGLREDVIALIYNKTADSGGVCKNNIQEMQYNIMHEFSHAFGIGHLLEFGHIMSPNYYSDGYPSDFTPLDKSAWCCEYKCTPEANKKYPCSWDAYEHLED
jgi:hypothetical protein